MAHCCKLEYQKRGLPHIHLLMILHGNHYYLDFATIDENISTMFLDKDEEPQLYEIISGAMGHRPYDEGNSNVLA